MKFNKKEFIEKNNEFLYNKLLDFLESEIRGKSYRDMLKQLASKEKDTNYEGNQYLITRQKGSELVIVIDGVSEKYGVETSCTRFTLSVDELTELITDYINN